MSLGVNLLLVFEIFAGVELVLPRKIISSSASGERAIRIGLEPKSMKGAPGTLSVKESFSWLLGTVLLKELKLPWTLPDGALLLLGKVFFLGRLRFRWLVSVAVANEDCEDSKPGSSLL